MSDEMMSAGKWAKEFGVSPKKFKEALTAAGVEPDEKKSGCAYYSKSSASKAKKKLG